MIARVEHFISVWESAESPGDAARKLGISARNASYRAAGLRRIGVALKRFPPRRPIDVERMNELVRELRKDG